MRALKMRSAVAGHRKSTRTNWEQSLKLIFLQLHEKLPKNSMLTSLWSFSIRSKLERWKSLTRGYLMSWLQILKSDILSVLLFCATAINHFLIGLWHATKTGFYTTSDDQLSGWNAKKLQSSSPNQTCTKIRPWSLVVCYLSDLLQLSESRQNHYIWEVCSANRWDAPKNYNSCNWYWSTERAQFFSVTWLHITQPMLQKNNLGHNFCLRCSIHVTSVQLTTTSSNTLTTFCRENASTISRMQKKLSKSLLNSKA